MMNIPENILDGLDELVCRRSAFALYRLPWAETCCLVGQTTGETERMETCCGLNGKRGFVVAPFRVTPQHPLVLIRPDVVATGWEEIGAAVRQMRKSSAGREVPGSLSPMSPPAESSAEKVAYGAAFGRFIDSLHRGDFQKLVLSRSSSRAVDVGFSPSRAFAHACDSYPRMMVYLCHTPETGTWMGSTPEMLLSGEGEQWHTVALAGTMPVPEGERFEAWDVKNRKEQAFVADYVRQLLERFDANVVEHGPYPARAGQLVHLKSDFKFQLKDTARLGSLLEALHPTPAVCGLPKEDACRFIVANEGCDRNYYSGFIGWLAPDGYTNVYVNLRCMAIEPGRVVLYAGGGILPSSELEQEWKETEEKMKTMEKVVAFCASSSLKE